MVDRIVIDEHGDLDIYSSRDEACIDVESIDVRNDEYIVYDEQGNLYRFDVERDESLSTSWLSGSKERIVMKSINQNDAAGLAKKITEYLVTVGHLQEDEKILDLEGLVSELAAFLGKC